MPCSFRDLHSPNRDWTWAPAVKVWTHNHWTMREVPGRPLWNGTLPTSRLLFPTGMITRPDYTFTCSSAYFLSLTLEYNSHEDKDLAWFPVVSPAPRIVPGTSQVPNKYLLSRACVYYTQPKAPWSLGASHLPEKRGVQRTHNSLSQLGLALEISNHCAGPSYPSGYLMTQV